MAQESELSTETQLGPLLLVADVAREFEVTTETVRRWVRDGKLAAVRLPSGRMKFRREDVQELLAKAVAITEVSA